MQEPGVPSTSVPNFLNPTSSRIAGQGGEQRNAENEQIQMKLYHKQLTP